MRRRQTRVGRGRDSARSGRGKVREDLPDDRHAVLEDTARQELPEFALDELRQARAVAGRRHRAQEDLEVLGDDLVEHGVLGVAGPVDRSLEGHGPQVRSRCPPGQC